MVLGKLEIPVGVKAEAIKLIEYAWHDYVGALTEISVAQYLIDTKSSREDWEERIAVADRLIQKLKTI